MFSGDKASDQSDRGPESLLEDEQEEEG